MQTSFLKHFETSQSASQVANQLTSQPITTAAWDRYGIRNGDLVNKLYTAGVIFQAFRNLPARQPGSQQKNTCFHVLHNNNRRFEARRSGKLCCTQARPNGRITAPAGTPARLPKLKRGRRGKLCCTEALPNGRITAPAGTPARLPKPKRQNILQLIFANHNCYA